MMRNATLNFKILSRLLKVFLGVCFSFTFQKAQAQVNPMNVLFIGNSYTHMNKMPELFEKMATSKGIKINVEMDAKSNHTFKMHSERPELFEHIKEKRWDYVVIQGFSRELSFPNGVIDTASIPYFNKIVDSIYYSNPCTNILLYMTWGYKDGFKEREDINTNEKMLDSVRRGYKYLSDLYDIPIVPVGDIFKAVSTGSQINLYADDQQHPTLQGSYLIASAFYSAIFKSSPEKCYSKNLDEKDATLLQTSAYNYIINNLDEYKLKQNTLRVKPERNSKGEFYVHCEANYPCAVGVTWDFGDGNTSDKNVAKHKYKSEGTYWITLKVEDSCGSRTIKRKVVFKDPPKPSPKKNSSPVVTKNTDKKI